jgi:hypothetical protein
MIISILIYGLIAATPHDTTDIALLKRAFSLNEGSTYHVTIAIDLPGNCSSKRIRVSRDGLDAGHCALRLEEITINSSIVRTLGFYPANGVNLLNGFQQLPSEVRNDSKRRFDFTFTIVVTTEEFLDVLQHIDQFSRRPFYLFSFNCVDFCLEIVGPFLRVQIEKDLVFGKRISTPVQLRKTLLQSQELDELRSIVLTDCKCK